MVIKSGKFKYLRDIFVRSRYEQTLSKSIVEIIKKNNFKKKLKILDYGSGIEPSLIRLIKEQLSKEFIDVISHGYDFYDDEQIAKLKNKQKKEFYFKTSELNNSKEIYDFAIISDVLHHMDVENITLIKKTLNMIKSKSNYIIIKDHFQYGIASNQFLRFLDFFGNLNSDIKTPKKYFSVEQFDKIMSDLNLSLKYKILNNRYHPKFLLFLSNPKYHFIYLLE